MLAAGTGVTLAAEVTGTGSETQSPVEASQEDLAFQMGDYVVYDVVVIGMQQDGSLVTSNRTCHFLRRGGIGGTHKTLVVTLDDLVQLMPRLHPIYPINYWDLPR